MRTIRLLPVIALGASALALAPVARAQTSGTPPEAKALLPASVLATLLQNSVHVSGTVAINAAGVPVGSLSLAGDAAWQNQTEASFHVESSSPTVTAALGASTVDLVFAGQRSAVRVGTGSWQCSSSTPNGTTTTTTKPKSTTTKSKSSAKSSGKSAKKGTKSKKSAGSASGSTMLSVQALPPLGQPVNLGAEALEGAAVWHVQAKSTGSATNAATIDLFISQSDLTLKRIVMTATTNASPAATVTAAVDLSQYGEPVSVSLPAACGSSARTLTSAERTWIGAASSFLRPQTLLGLASK